LKRTTIIDIGLHEFSISWSVATSCQHNECLFLCLGRSWERFLFCNSYVAEGPEKFPTYDDKYSEHFIA